MSRLSRAAVVATSLLTVPALVLAGLPSSQAAGVDADDASTYLVGNLEDGLLTYEYFGGPYVDYGGSIDAAISFEQVGGHADDITAIGSAVSANLLKYTDATYSFEGHDYYNRAAGATGKAIVAMQLAGLDPTTHPDGNLVTRLEGMLTTSPAGQVGERIVDVATKDGVADPAGNAANNLGQAYAVAALVRAGSSHALPAASFLSSQQCSVHGGVPEAMVASGQGCSVSPSTDATALASLVFVLLQSTATPADSETVLAKATYYFIRAQQADGGFASGPTGDSNANSTGLAVAALRRIATVSPFLAGYATPVATRAATWLRGRQLTNAGPCRPFRAEDLGAVAYDDTALVAAAQDGITAGTEGQFLKATAQAAEGLLVAPGRGRLHSSASPGYVRAGSLQPLRVYGAAPGAPVCLRQGTAWRRTGPKGSTTYAVRTPARTAVTRYTVVDADGRRTSTVIKTLGATTLDLVARRSVRRDAQQRVVVTGLAAFEKVTVKVGKRRVATGRSGPGGRFVATFAVGGPVGARLLKVVGQFADRRATTTFRVTR